MVSDLPTAQAFATSWNNLPLGSVYSSSQFEDWISPLRREDIENREVLELGCGNGSIAIHLLSWNPRFLTAVDLGDSIQSARNNLGRVSKSNWEVIQDDLVGYSSKGSQVVVCIGVLHHLSDPEAGFASVIRNTAPGGRFHCWVYGREGNGFVVHFVEPLRKLCCRLPWWTTKYFVATPLAIPLYFVGKGVRRFRLLEHFLPMGQYLIWLGAQPFLFMRHVVFDQLVTPTTCYLTRSTIRTWLDTNPEIDPTSVYIVPRNGNSWKFGGTRR